MACPFRPIRTGIRWIRSMPAQAACTSTTFQTAPPAPTGITRIRTTSRPCRRQTVLAERLLAPAQRVEVLVTARVVPDARYRVRALRFEADYVGLGTYVDEDLLTLATTGESPAPPSFIPQRLRPIEDLGEPTVRQMV